MTPLEVAILRTVLYADVFSFPMTPAEIHHFLIHDTPVPLPAVEAALAGSPTLRARLIQRGGYVALAARPDLIDLRQTREQAAGWLMPLALRYGAWLARLPFVRMVAVTGALSMRNVSAADDDLDYILVTAPGRVWLARAFSILLVRLAKRRGITLCPNYVVAESALEQDRHDLFIAHEVTQMAPLYGQPLYERFRSINTWSADFLPNAGDSFRKLEQHTVGGGWAGLKRTLEAMFGGRLGDALENWEQRRKLRRFSADMQTPNHAARLDSENVKGHFQDHGYRVMVEYERRLREHGIADVTAEPIGQ